MTIELVLLSRVAYRGQEITGSGPGNLLALLAGDLRTGCGTARLIDELWPAEKPAHPGKALQILVSRVRARLAPEVIVSTPTGYRLGLTAEQVDSSAVVEAASAAERDDDPSVALRHAEAGLALFAGAGDTISGDPLSTLRAARARTHRSLTRTRALALSRLGRHAEAAGPLGDLARDHRFDEEILAELLRCEAATAGAATALARYDTYRRAVRDELGSNPGPALQDLHRALLLSDTPPVRHGVRQEPNPMLGRDRDAAAVAGLLRTSRVTSIVGVGGLGKTRLAHAVARTAEQKVVHVVELAGVTADDDVVRAAASALGVREEVTRPGFHVARIAELLGPGLLVLDNCEHVIRGAAELVRALIAVSPDVRVLTTGRAPLRLSSEAVYQLPELDRAAMAELFAQRARAVRPGIELPPAVVRELCGRLDGLPLAVELAAARVRVMSVTELARRLDDRFELLRGQARDAPPRHRTLHAVIDWSWHLLDPAAQAAMRALSVFPGGFSPYASAQLLGSAEIVEQLVDQSLLRVVEGAAGTRFRMLESVREFSVAQREAAAETDAVIDRFLRWARDFDADLTNLPAIGDERDNLLQALRYGLDRHDGATVASTAALLGGLWVAESNFSRLAALAQDTAWVLSHFRPGPELVEATRTAAVLGALVGFVTPDVSPLRPLAVLRRLPRAAPDTLIRATHIVLCAPDVAALSTSDDRLLAAVANYVLSYTFECANEREKALRSAHRMLASLGPGDMLMIRALAYGRVGELSLQSDPGEPAFRYLSRALSLVEELGWSNERGPWALMLADIQRGAYDEAERELDAAVRGRGDDAIAVERFGMCVRAEILRGRGDVEGGLRMWRAAVARPPDPVGLWPYEVEAGAVIVHARHGRIELVRDVAGTLPGLLSEAVATLPVLAFPVCGTLLLALAMADLERGAAAPATRMIALAQRFGVLRGFLPDLDDELLRHLAETADRPAYAAAKATYAGLGHDDLRAAVPVLLRTRISSDHA
ncbi:AfsR/SARP family transcriptional regulator [Actinoplanes sp. TBRC 11911]|uniref:ATP-binding protein n=1 Tax=Actinoplanes sp. TBRC 11911 TaxID=2729386 RepID=UPI00145EDB23|nr:BTAD domain-containing putative transcriptional regulator [Actinoplanes sp. TBRC 11911]NMO52302.1 AfsR/SARP family transcriptional regulator [Actinoplanes sp. TBRC 11911]